MTATQLNLSDPRVKRTRQLIQQAFVSLLAQKSFDAVTVQDIAGRATVNRATFCAHYEDKYDLVASLAREQLKERLAASVRLESPPTASGLQRGAQTVFDFLAETYGHCMPSGQLAPMLERATHDALYDFIEVWLKVSPERGATRDVSSVTAEVVTSTLIGLGMRSVLRSDTGLTKFDVGPQGSASLARQVVTVLTNGIPAHVLGPYDTQARPSRREPSTAARD